jgi:hypothetical protein
MIEENPLVGVGPGHFEFGYLPYSRRVRVDPEATEAQVVRSPHNGYLELFAELGLPLGVSLLGVIIAFLWLLHQANGRSPSIAMALSVFAFIGIDALVAFPLESAYPFFCAAFFVGIGFQFLNEPAKRMSPFLFHTVGFGLLAMMIYLTGWSAYAAFSEAHYQGQEDAMSASCSHFTSHWRNCMSNAYNSARVGDLEAALLKVNRILDRQPANFVALKLKAEVELRSRRQHQACQSLATYDEWFGGESTLHSLRQSNCPQ